MEHSKKVIIPMWTYILYAMRNYFLLLFLWLPIAMANGQQLIVIPADTDTLENNFTIVAPVLEDYMYIDSLGNKAVHMDEWRLACRDYRFQRRRQEEIIEERKGGKVSGSVLFTLGIRSDGRAAGICINLKRKGNPWGFMARIDGLVIDEFDRQLFFQQTEDGVVYADRKIRDSGAVFGFGLSKKYRYISPFVMYNFGNMNRKVNWVDFSEQNESYRISGLQFGVLADIGRVNLIGSYTSAGDYTTIGLGFEIN